jgi:hypothetical protein
MSRRYQQRGCAVALLSILLVAGFSSLDAGAIAPADDQRTAARGTLRVRARTTKVRQQVFKTSWTVTNNTKRVVRIKSCEAFVWVISSGAYLNDYTHLRSVRIKAGKTARYQVEWRSTRLVYGIGPELGTRVNRCRL